MLKIKDNVDLKVLEMYGFKIITDPLFGDVYTDWNMEISLRDRTIDIIEVLECIDLEMYSVTLYNLIKAGLVEKVKEEEETNDAEVR